MYHPTYNIRDKVIVSSPVARADQLRKREIKKHIPPVRLPGEPWGRSAVVPTVMNERTRDRLPFKQLERVNTVWAAKGSEGTFNCKVSVRKTEILTMPTLIIWTCFCDLHYRLWNLACGQGIDSSLPLVQIAWVDRVI